MNRSKMRPFQNVMGMATLLGASLASGTAGAVDGVLELSQPAALASGYPIVIASSGSYRLTSNLAPTAGDAAITVTAENVEIDLNGFTITGSAGSPSGISTVAGGLVVRDGTIRRFAGPGILASVDAKVLRTHLTSNAGGGVIGGTNCIVVESVISGNTGDGISGDGCKIENNVLADNGIGISGTNHVIVHNKITGNLGGGIFSPGGSTIQQNVLSKNGAFGISDGGTGAPVAPPPIVPARTNIIGNVIGETFAGPGISYDVPAVITDNIISTNFLEGIRCASGCSIRGNTVESNNTSAAGLGGITVGPGSNVHGNAISFNTGVGLTLPLTAGFSNNTFFGNTVFDKVPAAHPTDLFDNICSGAAC